MKNVLLFIILSLLFGCKQSETDNSFIENNLEKKFSYLNDQFMRYYALNPIRFRHYYDATKEINQIYADIVNQIENDDNSVEKNIKLIENELNILIERYELENYLFPLELNFNPEPNEKLKLNVLFVLNEAYGAIISSMTQDEYKFEKLIPLVIPEKEKVQLGEEFKAKIYLTVIDTTGMPMCFIGKNENGKFLTTDSLTVYSGIYSFMEKANKKGLNIINGQIVTMNYSKQELDTVNFKFDYTVQ